MLGFVITFGLCYYLRWCQSDMLGFVIIYSDVNLICWALLLLTVMSIWYVGLCYYLRWCQSDMLGFVNTYGDVSLICWALSIHTMMSVWYVGLCHYSTPSILVTISQAVINWFNKTKCISTIIRWHYQLIDTLMVHKSNLISHRQKEWYDHECLIA